jgi:hypothetical protein
MWPGALYYQINSINCDMPVSRSRVAAMWLRYFCVTPFFDSRRPLTEDDEEFKTFLEKIKLPEYSRPCASVYGWGDLKWHR